MEQDRHQVTGPEYASRDHTEEDESPGLNAVFQTTESKPS